MKSLPSITSGILTGGLLLLSANGAIAANLSGSSAVSSFASKIQSPACDAGFVKGYTHCVGSYSLGGGENDVTNGDASNLATKILATGVFNGIKDWKFDAKKDGGSTGLNSSGFSVNGLNKTSGTFDFSKINLKTTSLAISLKSSRGFSIYYIAAGSLTKASDIEWRTNGVSTNKNGTPQGLSHASVFLHTISAPKPRPVPEPASVAALGVLAVGTLRFLKKR